MANIVPIWSTDRVFYFYLYLYVLFLNMNLCTSNTLIIFTLKAVPMSLFHLKLFFFFVFRLMDDSCKRSHKETGNMPHKPAEKKTCEMQNAKADLETFIVFVVVPAFCPSSFL